MHCCPPGLCSLGGGSFALIIRACSFQCSKSSPLGGFRAVKGLVPFFFECLTCCCSDQRWKSFHRSLSCPFSPMHISAHKSRSVSESTKSRALITSRGCLSAHRRSRMCILSRSRLRTRQRPTRAGRAGPSGTPSTLPSSPTAARGSPPSGGVAFNTRSLLLPKPEHRCADCAPSRASAALNVRSSHRSRSELEMWRGEREGVAWNHASGRTRTMHPSGQQLTCRCKQTCKRSSLQRPPPQVANELAG